MQYTQRQQSRCCHRARLLSTNHSVHSHFTNQAEYIGQIRLLTYRSFKLLAECVYCAVWSKSWKYLKAHYINAYSLSINCVYTLNIQLTVCEVVSQCSIHQIYTKQLLHCDNTSHTVCCVLTERIFKVYTRFALY
jgi:hypothetical protein